MEFGENGAVIKNNDDGTSDIGPTNIHAFPDGPRGLNDLFRWARYALMGYIAVESLMILVVLFLGWLYLPSTIVPFDMSTLERIDLGISAIGIALIVTFFGAAFMVARFTFRAMRNLHTVGSKHADMSPGWAVGWYFIPFANLFKPAQGMSQIVHGTRHAIGDVNDTNSGIPLWWTCWLMTNFSQTIADRIVRFSGDTIDTQTQLVAFAFDGASSTIGIVSAWALIQILRPVADAHEQLRNGGVAQVFD